MVSQCGMKMVAIASPKKRTNYTLPRMNALYFDYLHWRIGSNFLTEFGIECRFQSLTSHRGKEILRKYAVGWAPGDLLPCRPKQGHVGIMYFKDGRHFWVHLRQAEFEKVFND